MKRNPNYCKINKKENYKKYRSILKNLNMKEYKKNKQD